MVAFCLKYNTIQAPSGVASYLVHGTTLQTSILFCNAWGRVVFVQNHLQDFCIKYAYFKKMRMFLGSSSVITNIVNTEKIIWLISPGESCLPPWVYFKDVILGSFFRIKLMFCITVLLIYFNLYVNDVTGPYHSTVKSVLVIAGKNNQNISFRNKSQLSFSLRMWLASGCGMAGWCS